MEGHFYNYLKGESIMDENAMTNKVTEVAEEIMTTTEVPEIQEGNGIGAMAIGLGLAAVAGVGTWLYKNREKITARRIKRWEKKGYVVLKAEDLNNAVENVEEVEPIE
jgi:hypothetical protein